jgi:hypothetical protein
LIALIGGEAILSRHGTLGHQLSGRQRS